MSYDASFWSLKITLSETKELLNKLNILQLALVSY